MESAPGESWLHINVVINWQLSKQGIRWPVPPDRIAGSGVHPSRSSIFWSYPLTIYSFSNDRRLTFTFFSKFISNMFCLCQYRRASPRTITILISNWPPTHNSASLFKIQAGKTFSYHGHVLVALDVQFLCSDWLNLTGEFMRKIYAASSKLFTLTAEADRVLSQLVMLFTVFFHFSTGCTKWNTAAIKSVLLFMAGLFIGFLVKKYNASLVKADNPISDGIVFVFHLAGCVREL